jgi:hypothetical protein
MHTVKDVKVVTSIRRLVQEDDDDDWDEDEEPELQTVKPIFESTPQVKAPTEPSLILGKFQPVCLIDLPQTLPGKTSVGKLAITNPSMLTMEVKMMNLPIDGTLRLTLVSCEDVFKYEEMAVTTACLELIISISVCQ